MPIRIFLVVVLLGMFGGSAEAAEPAQLDGSQSLFTVLAAINAAGYDANLESPSNHPLRARVRAELARADIPALGELRRFFRDHRQPDWESELSQYVSFALSVDGPPAFEYRFRQNELPPDVVPLEGLGPLMARFYREADIASLWERAQPDYDAEIARYHEPLTRAVMEASAYLRTETSGFLGWRFQVFVDLLAAPHQVHTRSYGSEYFVVVTPSVEPQTNEVRHAYLHFLLDPLATKYADTVLKYKALGEYAQGAPFLESAFKSDFLLLASECVIKAVESRLEHSAAGRQALVNQALAEGFVLTPHLAEQLAVYEAQDRAMRFFYPELYTSISLRKEERRLEKVEFAQQRPERRVKSAEPPRPALTGARKTLGEAEMLYEARDYERARSLYLKVLNETGDSPLRARAYHGLARIAALEKNPELAEQLFEQALESSPDVTTAAWSHLYLGRLVDLAGERGKAEEHYKAVLAMQEAPAAARKAAESGLREGFGKR